MKIKFLLLVMIGFTSSLLGQKELTTKSVSVFKNGAAFFVKKGKITPTNYNFTTSAKNLPQASFGTFWVSGDGLNYVRTFEKTTEKVSESKVTHSAGTIQTILMNNIDKRVTLFLRGEEPIAGLVKRLNSQLLVLENEGQWINIPLDLIKWVSFDELPNYVDTVATTRQVTSQTESLVEFNFQSNKVNQEIEMVYLQNGLGWLPQYKIELLTDKKAKLSLQAAIVNDAEDLENTTINFVVGYPNFKYASTPFLLQGQNQVPNFSGLLNTIGHSNNSDYLQFADRANRGGRSIQSRITYVETQPTFQSPNSITGQAEEDLHFYPIRNVTLPKGGRAYYPVFQAEIPIEHIYEVRLNENSNYNSYQSEFSFSENYKNKVWHTLKLQNNTKNPWTNGAAMVTKTDKKSQKPISQDELTYTPIGHSTSMKLTIAPNISVIDSEKEIQREVQQQQSDGYTYDIVTIQGEIKLKNYKAEAIHLNIRKKINGVLENSAPEWIVIEKVNPNLRFHKINETTWELNLKAGENRVIQYEYKVFVRR